MTYKTVFVRGADNEFHRFALLSVGETVAFVCKEDAYEAIVSGHKEAPGIGFPLSDVYVGYPGNLRLLEHVEA